MSFLIYDAFFLFSRVVIGSLQHIFPIVIAILFSMVFINYAKRLSNSIQQKNALHIFACFVSVIVIVFHVHKISLGYYNVSTDLPLYLCSLLGLLIPIFTYYRKFWMYEILVFWIIGGTLQAVITPDIALGFPSFDYFRYWIVHLGLLIIIFSQPTFLICAQNLKAFLNHF